MTLNQNTYDAQLVADYHSFLKTYVHVFLIISFDSTFDVGRSMFDVHLSSVPPPQKQPVGYGLDQGISPSELCLWTLPVVHRRRLFPAPVYAGPHPFSKKTRIQFP